MPTVSTDLLRTSAVPWVVLLLASAGEAQRFQASMGEPLAGLTPAERVLFDAGRAATLGDPLDVGNTHAAQPGDPD